MVTAPQRHAEREYELVGEEPLGGAELAAAVGGSYRPGSPAGARGAITAAGEALPFQVPMLVGTYSAIAAGFLDGPGIGHNALTELLGRRPRSALEVYTATVTAARRPA